MGRLRSLLILLLVLTTGSALTLACAFLCDKASAAAPAASHASSHCHQAAPAKFPAGEGVRPAHSLCPVMDSLHGCEAKILKPVAKAPVGGVALLPFESSLLAIAHLSEARPVAAAPAPLPKPSPPFLRNLVLRL